MRKRWGIRGIEKKREYDLGGIMSEMVRGKEVENGVMG